MSKGIYIYIYILAVLFIINVDMSSYPALLCFTEEITFLTSDSVNVDKATAVKQLDT